MSVAHDPDCLRAALVYAGRGWPVLPLHTIMKGHCSCGNEKCDSAGKHPLGKLVPKRGKTPGGVHLATTDPKTIRNWWGRYPDANVGIATGARSGLAVLDVDMKDADGEATLRGMEAEHGDVPETVEAHTGGGGRHLLFGCPPGAEIPNKVAVAPGLDVRAEGGYIVAPPSLHASGNAYQWEAVHGPDDVPLAPLPSWLLNGYLVVEAPNGTKKSIKQIKDGVPEGERNSDAARLAGSYLACGLGRAETLVLMRNWNADNKPPLPDDELVKVVDSIARRELLKRGEAPGECDDRETVLQAVSECFNIGIDDIVRIGGSEPTYRIYACERIVELSAGDLESQSKFRKAMVAVAERVPHRVGPKAKPGWDHWLQLMLDAARPVEPGEEATHRGQLKLWLGRYLESREAKPHGGELEEAGDPFLHEGQIYVSLDQFHRFVDTEFGEKIDQKRLAQLLSAEGSNSGDFQVNIVGGGRKHRHMWPVPASLYDPKSRPT